MSDDFMLDTDDLERRMEGAMANLKTEFASLRTGRASASMLEPVMVDAYGSMTPINQVGTVNVPEPRMVTVNVWDKGLVGKVEKAIRESGLGINPQLNGTIIMLPIPELNEERRRELGKVAGSYAENARVSIRNVRRDGMDQIKKGKGRRYVGRRPEAVGRRSAGDDGQVHQIRGCCAGNQTSGDHAGLTFEAALFCGPKHSVGFWECQMATSRMTGLLRNF